jgi:hypothetical protein
MSKYLRQLREWMTLAASSPDGMVNVSREVLLHCLAQHEDTLKGRIQERATRWAVETFPPEVVSDRRERAYRFLEEALELVQSLDIERKDAEKLVDYVFSRPVGIPSQELGGTMVTLSVLSSAIGMDMLACGVTELTRCERPEVRARIQAKQVSKRLLMSHFPPNTEPPTIIDEIKFVDSVLEAGDNGIWPEWPPTLFDEVQHMDGLLGEGHDPSDCDICKNEDKPVQGLASFAARDSYLSLQRGVLTPKVVPTGKIADMSGTGTMCRGALDALAGSALDIEDSKLNLHDTGDIE